MIWLSIVGPAQMLVPRGWPFLRRRRRTSDEPLVLRFLDKRIEEELRRAFDRRVEPL